jgi:hypothetical protein
VNMIVRLKASRSREPATRRNGNTSALIAEMTEPDRRAKPRTHCASAITPAFPQSKDTLYQNAERTKVKYESSGSRLA